MSALSAATLSGSLGSSLSSASVPPINQAQEPEIIRDGNQTAKNAYQEGLQFEDILVNELAQQMTASAGLDGSSSSSSSDGSGDSGDSASSSLGAYSSLLPQALSNAVMSDGGTGLALQLAKSIDPALNGPATGATK